MSKLVPLTMIALALAGGEALAQAARVPVGLRLTLTGAEAKVGTRVPVTVGLKNFKGEPVAATERLDVVIESSLPATIDKVTMPAGKDSVTTAIVFRRAGIAKLVASAGKLTPGYGVISITRQAASAAPMPPTGLRLVAFLEPPFPAAATPGLTLALKALASRVVPRNRVWTVTVLVAVLNDQREGVRVAEDLTVGLASRLGIVVPDRLTIPRGESATFVQVTSRIAGLDTITALSPAIADTAEETIEYEQFRASKLLLISTPSEVVTNGRSQANITVLLRDDDDHVVAVPDRDTRVVLRTDFGALSTSSTTIAQGRPDSEPIVLTSPRAGRATITAIAEGLETGAEEVSFVLPFLLIGLAAVGGLGGAVLRPGGFRRAQLGRSLALGAFLGAIFFALGMVGVPGMIPAIPLPTLEYLTFNEVGACLLGICGGYIGRGFLDDLLVKKGGAPREGVVTA